MNSHPSFLELDRLHAQGSAPEQHPHVGACQQCQQHLSRLAHRVAIPAWVTELENPAPRSRWARLGWLPPMLAAAAIAVVAVVLVPRVVLEETGPGYRTKGAPSVVAYLKQGDTVTTWRPGVALRPGDSLRLELSAEGFSEYGVLTRAAEGWAVIAQGRLESSPLLLPEAWRVDGTADEELRVVFSRTRLEVPALQAAAQSSTATADRYTVSLTLPKEANR